MKHEGRLTCVGRSLLDPCPIWSTASMHTPALLRDAVLEFNALLARKDIRATGTRLSQYVTVLDEMNALEGVQLEYEQHFELFDRYALALREVYDLMLIQRGLSVHEPPGTDELLKIIVGGQLFAANDEDRRARNFQFQLRIASYFLRTGHVVDLSKEADVVALLSCGTLHIECKRMSSAKQVDKRVKECARQLKGRLAAVRSMRQFGLAVFDVTKLAYPHEGVSWGPDIGFARFKFQARLSALANEFDFSGPLASVKGVLGVWLQLSMPFQDFSVGQMRVMFSSLYIPLAKSAGPTAEAFTALRRVLDADKDL